MEILRRALIVALWAYLVFTYILPFGGVVMMQGVDETNRSELYSSFGITIAIIVAFGLIGNLLINWIFKRPTEDYTANFKSGSSHGEVGCIKSSALMHPNAIASATSPSILLLLQQHIHFSQIFIDMI